MCIIHSYLRGISPSKKFGNFFHRPISHLFKKCLHNLSQSLGLFFFSVKCHYSCHNQMIHGWFIPMNMQVGLKQKVTKLALFFVFIVLISVEKLMNEWVNEGMRMFFCIQNDGNFVTFTLWPICLFKDADTRCLLLTGRKAISC